MVGPIKNQIPIISQAPSKKKVVKEINLRIKKAVKKSQPSISEKGEGFLNPAAKRAYLSAEKAAYRARQKALEMQKEALKAQKAVFLAQRAHMAQQSAAIKMARAAAKAKKEAEKAAKKASGFHRFVKIKTYTLSSKKKKNELLKKYITSPSKKKNG